MDPKTMVECMREDLGNGCEKYDKREMKLVLARVGELEHMWKHRPVACLGKANCVPVVKGEIDLGHAQKRITALELAIRGIFRTDDLDMSPDRFAHLASLVGIELPEQK